jgi:hypothetical protein
MMSVPLQYNGESVTPGSARALFQTRVTPRGAGSYIDYDVSPDGKRFLIATVLDGPNATPPSPVIVLNWTAVLHDGKGAGERPDGTSPHG